jgi:hypothetical protein
VDINALVEKEKKKILLKVNDQQHSLKVDVDDRSKASTFEVDESGH